MNQQEARIALNKGEKITHTYFSHNEFITVKGGNLVDENNYILGWEIFWGIRQHKGWQEDWSIYQPKSFCL